MLCDDGGRLLGRGAGVGNGVARCLEDGLVYPLRMLTGRTFSDGRILWDDGGRASLGRGTGVGEGVACCLEDGLVYPLRMLVGGIFSDGWTLCRTVGGLKESWTGAGEGCGWVLDGGLFCIEGTKDGCCAGNVLSSVDEMVSSKELKSSSGTSSSCSSA